MIQGAVRGHSAQLCRCQEKSRSLPLLTLPVWRVDSSPLSSLAPRKATSPHVSHICPKECSSAPGQLNPLSGEFPTLFQILTVPLSLCPTRLRVKNECLGWWGDRVGRQEASFGVCQGLALWSVKEQVVPASVPRGICQQLAYQLGCKRELPAAASCWIITCGSVRVQDSAYVC